MRTLLVLAGLLGGAVPVAAETPNETTAPGPRFDDTVIVTASLEEEPAVRLGASVEVIEAAEIELRQATEVADLLATVPGLTVMASGSAGKVTSLFTRGTESDHTLVLWNGIKLNNPFFGGFDWAFLPTDGVERVEIVRGPFSAIHGSDALGGAVQILSGESAGGSLRLEAGGSGYQRLALATGAGGERGWFDVMGHVRRGDGEAENDYFDSSDAAVRGRWTPRAALSVSLLARANTSDNGIPFSGGVASPRREVSWQERQLALPVSYRRGAWEVAGQMSYVTYSSVFTDPDDAFGFTASDTDSESSRLRATAVRRLSESSWIAFGSELEKLLVDDRSVFGVNLDGAEQTTTSTFAQLARAVGPVQVDVGLRHDSNDVFGSRTTPKIGLVVPVSERARIRASWGEGFRAPSIGELFYPFSGTPTLEPEESRSWEVGLEVSGSRWQLGGAAFSNELENLIDFDFVTFTNRNVGRARTRGVETWLRYTGRSWNARANATLLDTEDLDTGESLLRRPDESGSVVITAQPKVWDLSFTAAYVGTRQDVDPVTFSRVTLGGHVRFDCTARLGKWERLEPYARLENLADRKYEEVAGYPAPGRQLIVGLATSWR